MSSQLNQWVCLVPQFYVRNVSVSPVRTDEELLKLIDYLENQDLSSYIDHALKRSWERFQAHECRVYCIQSPRQTSLLWMSWLGRRGSRWHVMQHFVRNRDDLPVGHKVAADRLVKKYQAAWERIA